MTRLTSVVAAQLIIIQVCNGRRRTGFGYYWEFPHRGRPMRLEKRKKRGVAIPTSICSVAADGILRTVGADDNFGLTVSDKAFWHRVPDTQCQ